MRTLEKATIARLNDAYLAILRWGLPHLRNLTQLWPERAITEAEHLHEIPSFINEPNALRHIDYYRRMRRSYLEDSQQMVGPREMTDEVDLIIRQYKREWETIESLLRYLPEWASWKDY